MRTWIDQLLVANLISSDVAVGGLHVHPQHSVIEIRDMRWASQHGCRSFGFSAERGWLAVEWNSLVNQRLEVPHFLVRDARLFMGNAVVPELRNVSNATPSAWEQFLNTRHAEYDWSALAEKFRCLNDPESVAKQYADRIQELAAQAGTLQAVCAEVGKATAQTDNPLRLERELSDRLKKVLVLEAEQVELASKLDLLKEEFLASAERMPSLLRGDLKQLESYFEEQSKQSAKFARRRDAELNLIKVAVKQLWQQAVPYVEIATRLTQSRFSHQPPAYDQNIWHSSRSTPFFEVANMHVHGDFAFFGQEYPFELWGKLKQTDPNGHWSTSAGEWEFQCSSPARDYRVLVQQVEMQRSRTVEFSDTLISSGAQSSGDQAAAAQPNFRGWLTVEDEEVQGELQFDAASLTQLTSPEASLLGSAMQAGGSEDQILKIALSGTWSTPSFAVVGSLPEGVLRIIEEMHPTTDNRVAVREELEASHAASVKRMQAAFETQWDIAAQALEQQHDTIAQAKTKLQRQLEETSGAVFADRKPFRIER
ncbi:hypothetical protein [Aureliella helgolandensis]|nr:hypothetical protein [Aureliella helgolandensis]